MSKRYDYDLIVIGSGSGGNVAAHKAASIGKKVAIFEKGEIGGECPNWACVPTKALLHAGKVFETAKSGVEYGMRRSKNEFDFKRVRRYKDTVVERTGTSEGEEYFTNEGIDVIRKEARFIGPHEITADKRRYTAAHFLIATGTSNFIPPIPGLEKAGYVTYEEAIDLTQPPNKLFIIGGGPIGCEFAQLYSSFNSNVYMAEMMPRLLAREDKEVGELIQAVFEERGIEVYTKSKVQAVMKKNTKKLVHIETPSGEHTIKVDEVLVAAGKIPNTDLGLENAGVEHDRRGVRVNEHMQTTAKHIYAAGDVTGPYQFTHTAAYQSSIAEHNMFHRKNKKVTDYHAVPRVTFVDPEAAAVGTTEEQLKAAGADYIVGATSIDVIGRANTEDSFIGFVKVLAEKDTKRILGASIVSPRAGEMIHELGLAINLGATTKDIARTLHAFPTYSEAIKIACAKCR